MRSNKKYFKETADYFKKLAYKKQDRNDINYKHWRDLILRSFHYRCGICKSTEKVEAHHIESFEDNEKLRVDLCNGYALCKKCHREYHNTYSKPPDITRLTFNKFLKEKGLDGI